MKKTKVWVKSCVACVFILGCAEPLQRQDAWTLDEPERSVAVSSTSPPTEPAQRERELEWGQELPEARFFSVDEALDVGGSVRTYQRLSWDTDVFTAHIRVADVREGFEEHIPFFMGVGMEELKRDGRVLMFECAGPDLINGRASYAPRYWEVDDGLGVFCADRTKLFYFFTNQDDSERWDDAMNACPPTRMCEDVFYRWSPTLDRILVTPGNYWASGQKLVWREVGASP